MRIRTLILILALLPLAAFAINSNAGEYGFQFLQIPANPISAALAGNGVYGLGQAGSFLNNPAANLMEERFSLSVQHTLWLVDTNFTQLVYSNSNRSRHFGLAARVLDYGEIEIRDDAANVIGNYHPLDASLTASYGLRLWPDHLLGLNASLVYEKLDTSSSYGLSADLGYVFLTPVTNAILFTSARNLGLTSKMDDETVKLPITFECGLGYSYPLDGVKISSQLAMNKAVDTDVRATLGAELAFRQVLTLRLGYKFNYDEESLTAGLGISWLNLDIDYGWSANTDRLEDTHSFGVTYNF